MNVVFIGRALMYKPEKKQVRETSTSEKGTCGRGF